MPLRDQLALLKARGMTVDDDDFAIHYLGAINYYRLAAYWLPYEINHATHEFRPGTRFEEVIDDYVFDRRLKLLVGDAIERVEVAFRTQFAYNLSLNHGSHFFLDSTVFKSSVKFHKNLGDLISNIGSSKEIFISHYINNYKEPLPPSWATVEIMTLGQLSIWYELIKSRSDRNLIAHYFDFDDVQFESFMHHLTYVRNICAHHGRLWNRDLIITFKLPHSRPQAAISSMNRTAHNKIYNTMTILALLLEKLSPGSQWKNEVKALAGHEVNKWPAMGFPPDWKTLPVWT